MGLLKFILGFDKNDYEELKKENDRLLKENEELREKIIQLQEKLEKLEGELLAARRALSTVIEDLESLKGRVEKLEEPSEDSEAPEEMHTPTEEDIDNLVFDFISKGITSPSDLVEATGLTKHKVYDSLKRLSDKGLITKKRDGRRVHYIPSPKLINA